LQAARQKREERRWEHAAKRWDVCDQRVRRIEVAMQKWISRGAPADRFEAFLEEMKPQMVRAPSLNVVGRYVDIGRARNFENLMKEERADLRGLLQHIDKLRRTMGKAEVPQEGRFAAYAAFAKAEEAKMRETLAKHEEIIRKGIAIYDAILLHVGVLKRGTGGSHR